MEAEKKTANSIAGSQKSTQMGSLDPLTLMINHVDHVEQVEGLRALASEVGQIAYAVHEYFGTGLLEKVYETAFEHRLQKAGYKVERQKPLKVYDYDGFSLVSISSICTSMIVWSLS